MLDARASGDPNLTLCRVRFHQQRGGASRTIARYLAAAAVGIPQFDTAVFCNTSTRR